MSLFFINIFFEPATKEVIELSNRFKRETKDFKKKLN